MSACLPLLAAGHGAAFTENKGQWPAHVLYRTLIPGGALFVERNALTYVIRTGGHMHHHHGDAGHDHDHETDPKVHAWRVHFEGGQTQGHIGEAAQPHYQNFFLGNDPAAWGTGCNVYGEVVLQQVWPGIDLKLSGTGGGLKYDLLVAPGADAAQARLRFDGQDGLLLKDGDLHVLNSAGTVIEKAPVVFSETGYGRREVASRYHLEGNMLSFHFPDGYDTALPLIIDPELSFASYVGSTADNFGFTATYDSDGHLYGGGVVFGTGYPSTVGALDPVYNGGSTDVGVSKWSPDGSVLIWSTYLGGSGDEAPHSLVVNSAHELYILGSTGSANFPTTAGCFDPTFNGGAPVAFPAGYGFFYNNGADVFVAHLNTAATALVGSTYFGGSGSDGLNVGTGLFYNYGDPFRGEIALDANEAPVVSTSTSSLDLPTSPGASQASYGGGGQDAYFFRMNPGLTTLLWGTYHGGSGHDSGYGVQFSSTGEVYTTGGTTSTNLPTAGSPLASGNSGGVDGYIARYNAAGTALLSATYLGTPQYDQSFFVQLDVSDNVYVVGQTRGNYPITPGKYAVPNSSQFIHKLTGDLSTSLWSTRIGNGNGNEDISPSAFLVSDCGQIYFSGWGGNTNNNGTPTASTTNGLPTTPGAFQTTTDGSDFYLMVLEPDADGLNYATFFGGATSVEHVDGGTSRFDKNGKVYQAVCAGCGSQDDFPTTPGAWSNTNNSSNCNLGVFKFDLSTVIAVISIDGPDVVCAPATIQFESLSSGGDSFLWYFGDGAQSTEQAPSHTYNEPGVYTVSLVVSDSYDCVIGDSVSMQITALPAIVASVDPVPGVCPGGEAHLMAFPAGQVYVWTPALGLNATDIQDPVATPGVSTTYQVVVSGECGIDSVTVVVEYADPQGSVMPAETICLGESVQLSASGGTAYAWDPPGTLNDPTSPEPWATPEDTTMYTVLITTVEGCEMIDSVQVNVVFSVPLPALGDITICEGASVLLVGPLADWYQWEPAPGINDLQSPAVLVTPVAPTTYHLTCGNVCGTMQDSAHVDLSVVVANAWPDTLVCLHMPLQLHATGGTSYSWSPASWLNDHTAASPICTPGAQVEYVVTVTNAIGCSAQASILVQVHPLPYVYAGEDLVIEFGSQVQLHGQGNGALFWEPADLVECVDCPDTWTKPEGSTLYTLTVVDANGCRNTDQVWVILNGSLFVPNTFTPNGDGVNDGFGAWGTEITEFRLMIFNRWGEMIYQGDHLDARWDGTYSGRESPIDTYVWRIDLVERSGERRTVYGHVNLVR